MMQLDLSELQNRCQMAPPKNRVTRFMTRRKHLLFYLDHYRFLWKPQYEKFQRQKYQAPLVEKNYTSPPFRFGGFWPNSFGHHRTLELAREITKQTKDDEGRPPGLNPP